MKKKVILKKVVENIESKGSCKNQTRYVGVAKRVQSLYFIKLHTVHILIITETNKGNVSHKWQYPPWRKRLEAKIKETVRAREWEGR